MSTRPAPGLIDDKDGLGPLRNAELPVGTANLQRTNLLSRRHTCRCDRSVGPIAPNDDSLVSQPTRRSLGEDFSNRKDGRPVDRRSDRRRRRPRDAPWVELHDVVENQSVLAELPLSGAAFVCERIVEVTERDNWDRR